MVHVSSANNNDVGTLAQKIATVRPCSKVGDVNETEEREMPARSAISF